MQYLTSVNFCHGQYLERIFACSRTEQFRSYLWCFVDALQFFSLLEDHLSSIHQQLGGFPKPATPKQDLLTIFRARSATVVTHCSFNTFNLFVILQLFLSKSMRTLPHTTWNTTRSSKLTPIFLFICYLLESKFCCTRAFILFCIFDLLHSFSVIWINDVVSVSKDLNCLTCLALGCMGSARGTLVVAPTFAMFSSNLP